MAFQYLYIPSTSHHGSDFVENSKDDLYAKNEFCVGDPCQKQDGHVCQILEEEKLVEDILCEPHNLSESQKEDQNKLMAAMKNVFDINALVARCCCKASGGEMEEESFMEECIALK